MTVTSEEHKPSTDISAVSVNIENALTLRLLFTLFVPEEGEEGSCSPEGSDHVDLQHGIPLAAVLLLQPPLVADPGSVEHRPQPCNTLDWINSCHTLKWHFMAASLTLHLKDYVVSSENIPTSIRTDENIIVITLTSS